MCFQILRWNLVSAETQTMQDLPNEFHPTDMHWFPRGHHGGGSVSGGGGNVHQKRGGAQGQGGMSGKILCTENRIKSYICYAQIYIKSVIKKQQLK